MLRHNSFINLDIHAQGEGRCLVQVGIDGLTPAERTWLFRLFQSAKEGRAISFGVDTVDGAQVLKFALASQQEVTQ